MTHSPQLVDVQSPCCQLKVKVTVKGQIFNKQLLNNMFCLLCKSYTNGQNSLLIIPLMAGYPSNLAQKFPPTEQFPQQILPLLTLYNAQWWGYESLVLGFVVVGFQVLENIAATSSTTQEIVLSESDGDVDSDDTSSSDPDSDGH